MLQERPRGEQLDLLETFPVLPEVGPVAPELPLAQVRPVGPEQLVAPAYRGVAQQELPVLPQKAAHLLAVEAGPDAVEQTLST